jgi:hypothetical protein
VRGAKHRLRVHSTSDNHLSPILVSADLGFLLSRCSRIAVREQTELVVLEAELLIQWRVLQVVTATPYLPCLSLLKEMFPGVRLNAAGFHVPTQSRSPEEVLADCMTHGIPVAGSRIIYQVPGCPVCN